MKHDPMSRPVRRPSGARPLGGVSTARPARTVRTVRTPRPLRSALAALAALGALGALSGCATPPPTAATPGLADVPLRSSFGPLADPAPGEVVLATASHEWDGFFTDARLRQVVGLALAGNRSLRAGLAAVDRARAQYGISEAASLPELRASASAGVQRSAGATSRGLSVSLGLAAWEIDLFDRVGSLQGAALARYLAQQETQRAARLSLVAEVANAWIALGAERQRLRLAEALRDSQQRTLALTQRQAALGAASGLQLARAQTAFEAARCEAARAAAVVTQARLALELLAGQPLPAALLPEPAPMAAAPAVLSAGVSAKALDGAPDAAPAASPSGASGALPAMAALEPVTALPDLPAGLPAAVLLQRPDLRAAEQALRAAAFDVDAARAALWPRLTLTANAGRRSPDLDGLLRSGTGFWSLVPTLDLPIFDAGARQAQVQANEATRRQALAQAEAALLAAFREVADALAVRDSLAERRAAQQAQVAAAQRSLALSEQGYRLGGTSQLELLDAQRQLATAQQGLVTLLQTEQANRVLLMRALGGRWAGG